MDKQRIKGAALRLKGSIKRAVGRLTGRESLVVDGKVDTAAGSVRTVVGETKDSARDMTKRS